MDTTPKNGTAGGNGSTTIYRQWTYFDSAGKQVTGRFVVGKKEPEGWVTFWGVGGVAFTDSQGRDHKGTATFPIEGAQTVQQAYDQFMAAGNVHMPVALEEFSRGIEDQIKPGAKLIIPGPFDDGPSTPPLRGR